MLLSRIYYEKTIPQQISAPMFRSDTPVEQHVHTVSSESLTPIGRNLQLALKRRASGTHLSEYTVVKVNLVSEDMSSSVIEQNTRPIATPSTPSVAAELVVGNVTLRLFNGADQNLIRCAMQCMGGATRAW